MKEKITPTDRTKIKRIPKHGNFERKTIYKILDESFVCHVGFTVDKQPYVIPTGYARRDNDLLIHGSAASRMMRLLSTELNVCVTVTSVDGLVLARSAFHHSMNYRSVVIFGKAYMIIDRMGKIDALKALSDHIVPHRWADVRPPNENELKATTVLSLPLTEASAKIRTGDPIDDLEDYALDVWAGVLPFKLIIGEPISDPKLRSGTEVPSYVSNYERISR